MSRIIRSAVLLLLVVALLGGSPVRPVDAQENEPDWPAIAEAVTGGLFSHCSPDRPHNHSDAVYRICTPPWWWIRNGDLVIWAHGYVDVTRPVEIPDDQLCLNDDLCIPDLVNFLGYDFATTSYSVNGLAVVPGIPDVVELVDLYTAEHGPPGHIYLVGASEGGLITVLAIERYPDVFDGGLATCGPIGDFVEQVNYMGDFRAVFDYFYPGLVPGDPTNIPPELMEIWDTYYADEVYPVLSDPANRCELKQLVSVTDTPYDANNLAVTLETSVSDLLWYNVFATNNANDVLGGQPFDNSDRVYSGSKDDAALNAGIQRFSAERVAVDEIEANYQTTGVLNAPVVTLHTILDQEVPYWHEELYLQKTIASGSWPERHVNYPPTMGYGHCEFELFDVLGAFNLLVEMATGGGLDLDSVEQLLSELGPEARQVKLHKIGSPEPR